MEPNNRNLACIVSENGAKQQKLSMYRLRERSQTTET